MVRFTLKHCWHGFAVVVIMIALLVTAGRLLVPLLDDYRQELADNLSEKIGKPLTIGGFSARWHGFGPWLLIRDIDLHNHRRTADNDDPPLAYIDEVELGINLWESMKNGQLMFDQLHLSGMQLRLLRQADGSIHLQGLQASDSATPVARNEEIIGWLLSQGRIFIDNSTISWQDAAHPRRKMVFRQLRFNIRNEGDRHQINVSGALPAWLGKQLDLAIDLEGNPLSADWRARGYLDGKGLALPAWLGERQLASLVVSEANADLQLWAEWQGRQQQSLAANLSLSNGRIDELTDSPEQTASSYRFSSLEGRVVWQRQRDAWSLTVPLLAMNQEGRRLENRGLSIAKGGPRAPLVVRAERLALGNLGPLLSMGQLLPKPMREYLSKARPDGHIEQLHVVHDADASPATTISAEIVGLALLPVDDIPGTQGLSALLVSDVANGHLRLHSPRSRWLLPRLFRNPLLTDQLDGDLFWRQDEQGLRIAVDDLQAANEDVQLSVDTGLRLPANDDSPFLYLYGRYHGGGVAHTGRYLPAGIMPAGVVEWLDQAILGGRVTAGDIRVHGPLRRFPFSQGGGLFKVAFHLSDGQLAFYPGWPRLEGIESDVTFLGNTMTIDASAGHTGELRIGRVQTRIPALAADDSHLELHGEADGPAQAVLDYLANSPLDSLLGDYSQQLRAEGQSHLNLDLTIPFHDARTRVSGSLAFRDSQLNIADDAFVIKHINGRLDFSEDTLSADAMQAELLGLASRIDIRRAQDEGQASTRIRAQGRLSDTDIRRIFEIPAIPWLSGKTDWQATLDLPDPGEQAARPTVTLLSQLQGIAIDLPAPLQKSAQLNRTFSARLPLPLQAGSLVTIRFGQSLRALMALDDQRQPARIDLHWGQQGKPRLPTQAGLRLSGRLPRLATRPWQDFFRQQPVGTARPSLELNEVDIRIDDLDLGSLRLAGLAIRGQNNTDHWQIHLDSKDIAGDIDWPLTEGRPLQMAFERLHLPKIDDETQATDPWHPGDLPALKISSQSFAVGDLPLGRLAILASKGQHGLHFSRLDLGTEETVLKGHGDWLETKGKQSSSFNFRIETSDLGGSLDRFGYAGTISQGQGHIDFSLRWPDSPDAFAWRQTEGTAAILIEKGRLLDVEPGAGRIFGLLSLNALPRRLTMDFSDVFRSGFGFDRLEGDFRIEAGRASTSNLYLDGPAARIEVKGSTDLAARLYDQEVIVSPHIGASLPIAGALAGGPVVGAAVLLAEKIFSHDIAKLTRVKYRVTGPWDKPEVTPVTRKP